MKTLTFQHSGKCGDCMASLSFVKFICEKENAKAIFYLDCTGGLTSGDDNTNKIVLLQTAGKGLKFPKFVCEYLKPLIEIQPYVEQVVIYDGSQPLPKIDYNLNLFRSCFLVRDLAMRSGTNLEYAHYVAFGEDTQKCSQWLFIPKSEIVYTDRNIAIARTPRYTSAHLWIATHEKDLAANGFFLGTSFEHDIFKETFDFSPKYIQTNSALHAAGLIAGSDKFLANGTLMYWIAVGLGHPDIIHELAIDVQTTWYKAEDRPNIKYIVGGRII